MIPLAAILYMLPSVVASLRRHHRSVQILTVNLLLGWTVVGWVYALERATSPIRRGHDDGYLGLLFLLSLSIALFLLDSPPRAVGIPQQGVAAVPEPSTALLMLAGLLPLLGYLRRR